MAWVIDTCQLIDVAENDPSFGIASATLIDSKRLEGLAICPVTHVELAPVFNGDTKTLDEFLLKLGANWPETWTLADTTTAHEAWHRYGLAKRSGKVPKRPVADILIGAFASRFDGLLSRNPADFRPIFPKLNLVVP